MNAFMLSGAIRAMICCVFLIIRVCFIEDSGAVF
jgi:hypothetical protein